MNDIKIWFDELISSNILVLDHSFIDRLRHSIPSDIPHYEGFLSWLKLNLESANSAVLDQLAQTTKALKFNWDVREISIPFIVIWWN
jgi:hypothetical protein